MKGNTNPYEKFSKEQLILRDLLAIDRTILANDRTFLSYIRTSLALVAAGAAVIHFFDQGLVKGGGIAMVLIGIAILVIGYFKYKKMDKIIKQNRLS